jgi:Fe-S cluster biogenesis protein NfuA
MKFAPLSRRTEGISSWSRWGKTGVVKVRLMGACGSCPMSQLTLKRGVEARLKAKVPGVKEVVAV